MKTGKSARKVRGQVTRRGFLGLGAAAGIAALTAEGSAGADPAKPWLIGSVDRVESDRVLYVKQAHSNGPAVLVTLAAGATVLRDHAAGLTDFQPGDEVGVDGTWMDDGSYVADRVESTYRLLEAKVEAANRNKLVTDEGDIALTGGTRPRKGVSHDGLRGEATPVDAIEPGEHVIVMGRLVPARGGALEAVVVSTSA
jgi:hypothetical protein